jgi:hypothetical protein
VALFLASGTPLFEGGKFLKRVVREGNQGVGI